METIRWRRQAGKQASRQAGKQKFMVLWLVVNRKLRNRSVGFTLIELAIVIVIIGLLVGGVMVGKDLIFSANIRSEVRNLESITSGVNIFKMKYNCVVGDCLDATTFMGSDYVVQVQQVNSAGRQCTGNGNGNGVIDILVISGTNTYCELSQASMMLSMSNVISVQVFPYESSLTPVFMIGYNNSWAGLYNGAIPSFTSGGGSSSIDLAISTSTYNRNCFNGAAMSSSDAQKIDVKIDDGFPTKGHYLAYNAPPYYPQTSGGGCPATPANVCVTANNYINSDIVGCKTLYFIPTNN